MGLGKLLRSPASSSSSSSQPRRGDPPPRPGNSRVDYPYGLNPPAPSTSVGLAHSYYHGYDDAPPEYSPRDSSNFHDYATDFKMPMPETTHTGIVRFPTPVIHNPIDSTGEDPLQALSNYDIVIILDDSHSMLTVDPNCTKSRWNQAWDALDTLVRVGMRYDRDGIDIHFLNERRNDTTIKSAYDLERLRSKVRMPASGAYTPTGDVLDGLLIKYKNLLLKKGGNLLSRQVKKRIFLVITDGAATDAPEDVIINAAKFYQKNYFPIDQVGIQFVQVGNEKGAADFLDELDRNLTEQMGEYARDIVDAVRSDGLDLRGDALVKALTGGFNRRQDRKGESRQGGWTLR